MGMVFWGRLGKRGRDGMDAVGRTLAVFGVVYFVAVLFHGVG
jgi:hypothetical protein